MSSSEKIGLQRGGGSSWIYSEVHIGFYSWLCQTELICFTLVFLRPPCISRFVSAQVLVFITLTAPKPIEKELRRVKLRVLSHICSQEKFGEKGTEAELRPTHNPEHLACIHTFTLEELDIFSEL